MEAKAQKQMKKQLTAKRDDSALHSAAREGNLEVAVEIINGCGGGEELEELLSKQNQSGETALYAAAECGHVELVEEMIKHYDVAFASLKANNGFDAFHIAAKLGKLGVLKALMEAIPQLLATVDQSNTTPLHTAAAQGHVEVVSFLLERNSGLTTIARNNGKTALHSSARYGHSEVVKAILGKEAGIAIWQDKKGQTALHMAVKGTSSDVVDQLISADASLLTKADGKGNTALHIATRKGRPQLEHTRQTRRRVRQTPQQNAIRRPKQRHNLYDRRRRPDCDRRFLRPSVVVVERKAKKQMMAVINKLMWMACAFVSIAFLALCYIIVGEEERWLAIGVTVIGSLIMATTLGTLCYWVIVHRIEASNLRSLRRSERNSRSQSWSASAMSDSDVAEEGCKKLYDL